MISDQDPEPPSQAFKDDINKIFENSKTPTGKENKLKIDTERSYKTLSQEIAKLRSSRSNLHEQSPLSKPKDNLTPKSTSQLSNHFFSNDFRDSEKEKPQTKFNFFSTTESAIVQREEPGSGEDKRMSDRLPLSKIYELQDLFYNVADKEFNDLSSEYVEELIKLSSVIMHRVKSSNYYTKS